VLASRFGAVLPNGSRSLAAAAIALHPPRLWVVRWGAQIRAQAQVFDPRLAGIGQGPGVLPVDAGHQEEDA